MKNKASKSKSAIRAFTFAIGFWLLAFILALKTGSVSDAGFDLIAELRLPRALLASAVGMGLAVSGAVLQAIFANPLCEPYTMGISGGASIGAVLGGSLGAQWIIQGFTFSSFAGALLFTGVLYLISLRSRATQLSLLLAGVMLQFIGSSLVTLWMALADSNGIQAALVWLLGDLSRARIRGSVVAVFISSLLVTVIWFSREGLDTLLLGEDQAMSVGISVPKLRRKMMILVSLLIGLCVSSAGMVGFVGLVVPHFSRKWVGSLHGKLIPLCAIWGAGLLTAADALSRAVAAPYELPVGVVMALAGAPVFLWVMLKRPSPTAGGA
jgi:vitamin B12 transport system permease protein